mgnify:FL=1
MLGAINVGTWGFFSGSIAGWFGIAVDTNTSAGFANQIIFVAVITGLQALINHFGIKLTAKLTDMSGYLIFAAAIALTIVCLIGVKSWDISRIWTFTNYSGTPEGDSSVWPKMDNIWYVFALGLLLPIYTITGYDASAHTSEETVKASSSVPRGMVSSVWWSSLFGYIMLLAFLLAIPDMNEASKQGWNVFFWTINSITNPVVANILYVAIFISQLLCGLATVTSASRMIYAFSRDGGLPFSKSLAGVSPKFRTPAVAIWTAAILSVLFVWGSSVVSVAGTSAYTIVVSCTVIFLFLSFTVPIVLGMLAWGTPKWDKMGPWNMGRGVFMLFAFLSLVSMILIFVIGIQPPNDWALYITIGFLVLTAIVWFAFEKRRFQGPPIGDMIAKRQADIAAAERAVGEV